MESIIFIIQLVSIIALAPLTSGFIAKIKNNLRMRRGQGVFQPYYNLAKLFAKEEVISENASWIFYAAPFIAFASSAAGLALIPWADVLALIFVLSLGRFFMALAGLDTASAFGGMGSSREMFVASFAELSACLAFYALAARSGSTSIYALGSFGSVHASGVVAVVALIMVSLAETSRIPVDNQETHLELTMIHEAMALEYSGRRLALIELSAHIRQMIWFSLIGHILFPAMFYPVKIALIGGLVAFIEVALAKMRLLRIVDYFGIASVLGLLAVIGAVMGI